MKCNVAEYQSGDEGEARWRVRRCIVAHGHALWVIAVLDVSERKFECEVENKRKDLTLGQV